MSQALVDSFVTGNRFTTFGRQQTPLELPCR
jgi:hypothetical protein